MPRAGFYNDNEYRAYPFVAKTTYESAVACPDTAIVDCGFIMGLDSGYDAANDFVYLYKITRTDDTFYFEFRTTAPGATDYSITFERGATATEWESEVVESAVNSEVAYCGTEPAWEGYLVTGVMADLLELLPANGDLLFYSPISPSAADTPDYTVEPARIQSLVRGYVRSISVGNYERVKITSCDASSSSSSSSTATAERGIVVNAQCLSGDLQLKPGFNCTIQQTGYDNRLTIAARKDANINDDPDNERCQYGSELPLYDGETPPENSVFLSGGPACNELITTINGLGGKNLKITGGAGIQITQIGPHSVKIGLNDTIIQQNC